MTIDVAPIRRGRRTECAHLAVAGSHHAPTNGTEECPAAGPRPARSVLEQGDVTAVPTQWHTRPRARLQLWLAITQARAVKASSTGGPRGPALTALFLSAGFGHCCLGAPRCRQPGAKDPRKKKDNFDQALLTTTTPPGMVDTFEAALKLDDGLAGAGGMCLVRRQMANISPVKMTFSFKEKPRPGAPEPNAHPAASCEVPRKWLRLPRL